MGCNIVLTGFMGTGKSTVGVLLARRLGRTFVDMDSVIEQRAAKPIRRIFAEEGEPHFRQFERRLVEELAAQSDLVVATGGGIVLNPDNVRDFERTGLVVCLSARPETILARIAAERHRPLLEHSDRLQRIRDLLDKRRPFYAAIRHQIATDALTAEEVAERVLGQFRQTEPGT
jgi:shikimate kinase